MEKRGMSQVDENGIDLTKWRRMAKDEKVIKGDVCFSPQTRVVDESMNWLHHGIQSEHLTYYRPIETPTDKPADEIKLGWYRNTDEELFDVRLVLTGTNGTSVCGLENGMVAAVSVGYFIRHYETYIGTTLPEPGEWVDPGDVKLSELPMRARFRKGVSDLIGDDDTKWWGGELHGADFSPSNSGDAYHDGSHWWLECQVWRPSK